jgi:hypothetical protein
MLSVALLAAAVSMAPQGSSTLDQELTRLHLHTALVIPAPQVEGHPLWSPASDRLAASVGGRWQTVDLSHLALQEGKLRGGLSLGMVAGTSSITESSAAPPWKGTARLGPWRVQLKSGLVLELRPEGDELSTSLVLTRPGSPEQVVWTTERESCHDLVAALDDKHVAFVCDQNGVFVIRPDLIPH